MRGRIASMLAVLLVLGAVGCGPKARIRDDPFAPTSGGQRGGSRDSSLLTPPPNQARDRAREVATTPDPVFPDQASVADRRPAISHPAPTDHPDPFDDRERAPSPAPSRNDPSDTRLVGRNGETEPPKPAEIDTKTTSDVRARLEKTGAINLRIEKYDRSPDETFVRCEVPHPRDPEKVRVFQAHGPDESKVLLAVTEAVEKWLAAERGP